MKLAAKREAEMKEIKRNAELPKTDYNSRMIIEQKKAKDKAQEVLTVNLLKNNINNDDELAKKKADKSLSKHKKFSPVINPMSRKLPARSLDDLVYGDALRKEDVRTRCQEAYEAEIVANTPFTPQKLSEHPLGVESKLKAFLEAPRMMPPWMVRPENEAVLENSKYPRYDNTLNYNNGNNIRPSGPNNLYGQAVTMTSSTNPSSVNMRNNRDSQGTMVNPYSPSYSFRPEIHPAPSIVTRINEEIRRQALLHNLEGQ